VAGEVVGSFTRSEPVVRMAETLIRHDYYITEIFNRLGKEIDREFGPFLVSLRRKTFSPEQLALLETNIKHFQGEGGSERASRRGSRSPR
jgi:hypothetical protein